MPRAVVVAHGPAVARLEAALDAEALLRRATGDGMACELRDREGSVLGAFGEGVLAQSLSVRAEIAADGWSPGAPWTLECATTVLPAVAMLEPVVGQYRTTLALNLLVMLSAVALGWVAMRETRRRQYIEDRAREEQRVREVERQLFHAERLSTAGRLAAGMAHEINNPLEGLSNYLSLARDAIEAGNPAAARRHLDRANEGLVLAAGIVRRVLDHSERSTPPFSRVDLVDVLRQSVDFVRAHERFRGFRFDLDVPPGTAAHGSPIMLGQVFLNLVLNACEAQGERGEVAVRARRAGDAVVVEVADRGPGVPPAERDRIFEAFHSTKGSNGLGLSVCRAIVRDHGGGLDVADREGGGAVFRVRLPAEGSDG
jgi:signal transduction histidine kinase